MKIKKQHKNRRKTSHLQKFSLICSFFLVFSVLYPVFPPEPTFAKTVQKAQVAASIPTIFPRSTWSNSTYDKRSKKLWPAEIETPKIIIIHHTATNYSGATSKQVKKIYKYHSYTKKWGDIGYNYIIGKDGSIFEGRYGGNGVIGGHAYSNGTNYNKGSIGISVIGNYVDEKLSPASLESLQKLVGWLAANNDIEIDSDTKFFSKKFDTAVIGHKDLASTACPGKNIYSNLSNIRTSAATFAAAYQKYAYQTSENGEKYEITGGKRYSGSSKQSVVSISKKQLEAYPLAGKAASAPNSNAITYPSGTLFKVSSENKRGMLENGILRPLGSDSVLSSSYDSSNFIEITAEKWAAYPVGAEADFRGGAFLKNSAGNYYIFSEGQKRKVDFSSADLKLFNLGSAHLISDAENAKYAVGENISVLSGLPEGTLLTADFKKYYYVSGNAVKKKISKNVFRATFSRAMAVRVSASLLKKYKTRGGLSFQSGATVNYRKKYFFVENNARRKFATKNLAVSLGFKNIPKATRTEMAGIGQGSKIE